MSERALKPRSVSPEEAAALGIVAMVEHARDTAPSEAGRHNLDGWPYIVAKAYLGLLRTQAERSREREEWQPIETAPKDGTWILGWSACDSQPFRVSWGRNHRGELAWCTSWSSFIDGYISHWAPLLDLPALTQKGRDG